jgi:amino acid transporter
VAGSVYTYAYTTLGEIFAWIIGWDIILEYSMGCATVASAWGKYLNKLLESLHLWTVPAQLSIDPFSHIEGSTAQPFLNLPAVVIMAFVTLVLVLGIRESARANAVLVLIKISVVFFVILAGLAYIKPANWNSIPVTERVLPQERVMPDLIKNYLNEKFKGRDLTQAEMDQHAQRLQKMLTATYRLEWADAEVNRLQQAGRLSADKAQQVVGETQKHYGGNLPSTADDRQAVDTLLPDVRKAGEAKASSSWGILGYLGLNRWLMPADDATRSPFAPYGFSGIMLGASIVFFAFIGFDSISTHAEEARHPQRDVPIGILFSLVLCTILYIAVAAVITGMVPYPEIDVHAPIAAAFTERAETENNLVLGVSGGLIAAGGLAGMTSVLLVLFLSQARVFMAMARDGLLPRVFGQVHPRFRTPHVATLTTGVVICLVAALTPIHKLVEMVNIGTLMAFAMVCAAVMILRKQRPDVHRPFRCPLLFLIAPAGIVVNLSLMLFLPLDTWLRLLIWLVIGIIIYVFYSRRHSLLTQHLLHEIQTPRSDDDDGLVQPAGE